MIWLAIPLGLAIGLSLGALGGGGSILTVPALVYLLGQDPRSATTGSLLIVGITSLFGTFAHARAGRVRVVHGLAFGVLGVAGSWAGSRLSAAVAPEVLLAAFAGLMLVVAAIMFRRSLRGGRGDSGDDAAETQVVSFHPFVCHCPQALKVVVTATAVGLLTGFFGVGGGFAVVPALVLSLGFSMPVAVGTSLLVITVNSASALAARLGSGIELDWTLLVTFTAAAIAGSLLGGRVASRVRPVTLTRAFTVLLALVAVYTAVRSVPQLF
ncbi:MAG: sulfite exporter TauE/SafE family protein [Angustibacter sp.]